MELTGKLYKDFFHWTAKHDVSDTDVMWQWSKLPLSMRFGLIQEFLDSVGINIDIKTFSKGWFFTINIPDESSLFYHSRGEAQIAAIEKANELYNLTNLKDEQL